MADPVFTPARPRDFPYIWVTWLTRLISGEASCEWALWFRARNQWDKMDDGGASLQEWNANHNKLAQWRSKNLREQGFKVKHEMPIEVLGNSAKIAGKADLSYPNGDVMHLEDCKTGKKRPSDHVQVLLYIWLFNLDFKGEMAGSVVYNDEIVDVDLEKLAGVKRRAIELIKMAASEKPPTPTPSPTECRFCNISAYYCADRQHSNAGDVFVTEEF